MNGDRREEDIDTIQRLNLYKADEDPPTERIPALNEEVPPPPEEPPVSYYFPPPPSPPRPPLNEGLGFIDPGPSNQRRRAGFAALCFALLLLGGFLGFMLSSFTAVKALENVEPGVVVSTKTSTATTTATATATKTKTVTQTPKPAPTKTIQAPPKTKTKTVTKKKVPESCKVAMEYAERYVNVASGQRASGRFGGRLNRLLREAREDYEYWANQCRDAN